MQESELDSREVVSQGSYEEGLKKGFLGMNCRVWNEEGGFKNVLVVSWWHEVSCVSKVK